MVSIEYLCQVRGSNACIHSIVLFAARTHQASYEMGKMWIASAKVQLTCRYNISPAWLPVACHCHPLVAFLARLWLHASSIKQHQLVLFAGMTWGLELVVITMGDTLAFYTAQKARVYILTLVWRKKDVSQSTSPRSSAPFHASPTLQKTPHSLVWHTEWDFWISN